MEPLIINDYFDINSSIVQIQQYGIRKSLVPPQKDCTNYSATIRSDTDNPEHVVIVIPGNPGIVGYYHDFNTQLYQKLNYCQMSPQKQTNHTNLNIPIIAISHNNFDYPAWNADGAGSNNLHTLRDDLADQDKLRKASSIVNDPNHIELQIRNKIVIIKTIFDLSRTKFTFIGHSIGCYIILRMLQDSQLNTRTTQAIFIHPALENLALTEKGTYWATLFRYKIDWFLAAFCMLLDNFLPDSIKPRIASFIKRSSDFEKISPQVKNALVQLSTYRMLQSTIKMAKSEFSNVKDLQSSLVEPLVDKLKIYYACEDHWVNKTHRQTLKDEFPNLKIKEKPAMHAFILEPSDVTYYVSEVVPTILEKLDD